MTGTGNNITSAIKKLHTISLNPLIKGLNSSEYFLLKLLMKMCEESNAQGVYVSDIAKKLKISTPTVTKTLNNLELKNCVVRAPDSKSKRNTLVQITEKGILMKKENDLILSNTLNGVYEKVGRENIVQFLHLAELIYNAFDEEIKESTK